MHAGLVEHVEQRVAHFPVDHVPAVDSQVGDSAGEQQPARTQHDQNQQQDQAGEYCAGDENFAHLYLTQLEPAEGGETHRHQARQHEGQTEPA